MKVKLKDLDNVRKPDMFDVIEDTKCPDCFGELSVGSYVCWGMCYECAKKSGKLPKFLS